MGYKLGGRSLQNLSGVHPDLVSVVKRAIEITEQDFSVIEGVRNINRQRELVKSGKSTTMNSRHLTGHAVDIVPYPVSWEWEDFYPVADAMKQAAEELDIPVEWGGAWHITPIYSWRGSSKSAYDDYVALRRSQGRKPFGDAPHFQLSWETYP